MYDVVHPRPQMTQGTIVKRWGAVLLHDHASLAQSVHCCLHYVETLRKIKFDAMAPMSDLTS